jgi:hypothetical protein
MGAWPRRPRDGKLQAIPMGLELTHCPQCGRPAEVIDRFFLPSTHGPVEHVKTRCVTGPWFVTPAKRNGHRAVIVAARGVRSWS